MSTRSRVAGRGGSILRVYGAARSGVLTLAGVLGAICILVFLAALVTNVRPVVVISGSMAPGIPVGSVVFTQEVPADDVVVGDIVTVQRPRDLGLVTHRVVQATSIEGGGASLILRGDANDTDDPQPYDVRTVGKYIFHIVGLGYVTLALQSGSGWFIIGGVAVFLIGLFVLDPSRLGADARPVALRERSEEADGRPQTRRGARG
ncbi:signal peptidase I [Microbacterium sp. SORGH_AS_0862]|uniref:signal peptidase I n=1 Tax=Microbacterium sp. SORGH_AS_0862 TaxID=3041789 RepID=UPI00278CF8E4|nr:signal peptidase I [Microbacterium sp. SORGH_AS_0862]MDQ1205232.1 signal peptidase [Microbacterium sp. SORGH_AS_0862]